MWTLGIYYCQFSFFVVTESLWKSPNKIHTLKIRLFTVCQFQTESLLWYGCNLILKYKVVFFGKGFRLVWKVELNWTSIFSIDAFLKLEPAALVLEYASWYGFKNNSYLSGFNWLFSESPVFIFTFCFLVLKLCFPWKVNLLRKIPICLTGYHREKSSFSMQVEDIYPSTPHSFLQGAIIFGIKETCYKILKSKIVILQTICLLF